MREITLLRTDERARIERLSHLHERAFAPHERGWSAAEISSLTERGRLFAAADDAGFALISLAADEAELLTIAVDPAAQRAGLGRALLRAAREGAADAGAAVMHLEVAADNAPARALYESEGFSEAGRRKNYYARSGGRIDALLFSASLTAAA